MKQEKAIQHFLKGMQLLQAEKLHEALHFFSQAIALDRNYAEAYQVRSQVLSQLDRHDEAKADLEMLQSLSSSDLGHNNQKKGAQQVNFEEIDQLTDDHAQHDDSFDFGDDIFGYAFSDTSYETDNLLDSLGDLESDDDAIPGVIEYVNGDKEEIPWTYPFEPTEDEFTLVRKYGAEGEAVSLGQITCIRLTRAPSGFPQHKDHGCHVEVIETIDGNIYHELIHPEQHRQDILFGFSTKEDTKFKFTLFPLENIKKRYQRRHLGQILLDKQLITDTALKNALNEHNDLKKIKFGKVLIEHAKLLQSAVEAEIQKAYRETKGKYKVGEILLNAGLVNEEQVQEALVYQKRLHQRKLGHFLIEKGIIQERDVYMALAEKFRIPFVDLRTQKGSKKALSFLPRALIQKLNVLPIAVKQDTLVVATHLPDPAPICEIVLRHTDLKHVDFVLAQPSHLRKVIRLLFQPK